MLTSIKRSQKINHSVQMNSHESTSRTINSYSQVKVEYVDVLHLLKCKFHLVLSPTMQYTFHFHKGCNQIFKTDKSVKKNKNYWSNNEGRDSSPSVCIMVIALVSNVIQTIFKSFLIIFFLIHYLNYQNLTWNWIKKSK